MTNRPGAPLATLAGTNTVRFGLKDFGKTNAFGFVPFGCVIAPLRCTILSESRPPAGGSDGERVYSVQPWINRNTVNERLAFAAPVSSINAVADTQHLRRIRELNDIGASLIF